MLSTAWTKTSKQHSLGDSSESLFDSQTMPNLEIIASSLEDALAAAEGEADSLELCIALEEDGLTPPLETVKAIRDAVDLPLNILLRPHSKSFVYSEAEIAGMFEELEALKAVGINTIVFGAQTHEGKIDIALVERFAQAAPLTLHRAIDTCTNPEAALDSLKHVVRRVLSSGTASNAWEGRARLKAWQDTYGESLRFAIASKVSIENIAALAQAIGAPEYHIGNAARSEGKVDIAKVRALKAALNP
jgi:copper homeostasis protein